MSTNPYVILVLIYVVFIATVIAANILALFLRFAIKVMGKRI
jgi:hypothetical protein